MANLRRALIREFSIAADEVVNAIKMDVARGGYRKYKDQTGNLTSSVGFALVEDGAIIYESEFVPLAPTAQQGADAGREYVQQLAAQYPSGITVIVVAGMNYAAYVEAKGLGGMRTGEMAMRQRAHDILTELANKLKTQKALK